MAYEDFIFRDGVEEDIEKAKKLEFGSEDWKRVMDSADKRHNTTLAEAKLSAEMQEKEARLELERMKLENEVEIRRLEAEIAEKKSKREHIGKLAGIGAGVIVIFGKIMYDNSEAITDKFTLDAGSKLINNK